MRALALCLAFAACGTPAPELTPAEREAGGAALAGWLAAGLPSPAQNDCVPTHFYVRLADASDFNRKCRSTPQAAAGCLNWEGPSAFLHPERYPIVVISPNWRSEPGIIIHELMHAFTKCAGLGAGPMDYQHLNPRIWQAAGGESSAQAQALGLIGQNN